MNANELTFGVEIETVAPATLMATAGLRLGPRHRGIQVPYLPAGWRAEADGSIRCQNDLPCEIVSPVLQGDAGLRQVIEVLKTLVANGHHVNASCGVHVHVGWKRDWPAAALARLVTIVAYLERGLYAITGTTSRERGHYCRSVRRYGNFKAAKPQLDVNRYHALNLQNLATGSKATVEFRVFSGSLNAIKICGWIQVCLGLVERALNGRRAPRWSPAELKGGWAKGGPGASETERLLGYLAWGEGYARLHDGHQYGWISDAIPQDAVKAEFRRLARKYDANP